MPRWEPDAAGRLQQAAMSLFLDHGYAAVTVAQIAERAGVTKRTFFNHFPDKREVLFAGAQAFEDSVVAHVRAADPDLPPLQAAIHGLTRGGLELSRYGQFAAARRDLIASSTELRERDLIKTTALTAALTQTLRERGSPDRTATLAAQSAVAVFTTAYTDWADDPTADLTHLVQSALQDLRAAID